MSFKSCTNCKEEKPVSDFYLSRKSRSKDGLQSWCKSCSRVASNKAVKEKASRVRQFLNEYKLSKGCIDCGYKQYAQALDFDHLGNKEFGLSYSMSKSMDKILEEIAKCEVVCANCHRVRTYNRMKENVIQKCAEEDS